MTGAEVAVMDLPAPTNRGAAVGPLVAKDLRTQYGAEDVAADIDARIQKGIETYGSPLRAHNGRAYAVDAYQEALDLCNYLKQMELQRGYDSDLAQHYDMAMQVAIFLRDRVEI